MPKLLDFSCVFLILPKIPRRLHNRLIPFVRRLELDVEDMLLVPTVPSPEK